jgi:hypothetical protein
VIIGLLTSVLAKEAPVSEDYDGRQFVGIDLHRRRSVLARMTETGRCLSGCGSRMIESSSLGDLPRW